MVFVGGSSDKVFMGGSPLCWKIISDFVYFTALQE